MKLCSKLLALLAIAFSCALTSCSGPSNFSYQNVAISLAYYPVCNSCATTTGNAGFYYGVNPPGDGGYSGAVICSPAGTYCTNGGTVFCDPGTQLCATSGAVMMPPGGGSGGCIELFATVKNAPVNPTWTIVPTPNPGVPGVATGTAYPVTVGGPSVGTIASQTGSTNFYCEPSSIPIYTGPALAQAQAAGLPQGTTEVVVTNPADPNNPSNVVSANMKFTYQLNTPPSGVLVGIFAGTSVTVPLSGTYPFTGYVAGTNGFILLPGQVAPTGGCTGIVPGLCNASYSTTWALSACTGGPALVTNPNGSTNYGTLNTVTGAYTAPAAYPSATTHCANITVASTAYPSIISVATVINFP